MANVVIDQWNKMYELISHHKFTIIGDVNDDYKCGICKNMLINAHQAICGCHFCYECINQHMANGAVNCPNRNEECELGSLSSIVPNHRINKLISNLTVQCSNKMCPHKCRLIEMENHLNSCLNRAVKCPFNNVDREHDDMINNQLNGHMLSDIHNHNKILIDLIGNLRNEMGELGEEVLNSCLNKAVECPFNDNEYLVVRDDLGQYMIGDLGKYEWKIGKISEIRETITEIFYYKQNPYKMYFNMENINNESLIWLHIYGGQFDQYVKWPCRGDITIDISALNADNSNSITVTKSFIMGRADNPYKFDPIKISHSDLTKSNLINEECLLKIFVKFK